MTAVVDRSRRRARTGGTAGGLRKFRPDIEGLRAIAVLLVVLFHAGVPGLPGGYVGVDIFFVISGYLITTHLLTVVRTGRPVSLSAFYARRVRRLLPAATLVVIATVIGTWAMLSVLQARQVGVDALWTAVFAMNFHLALTGVDYQANQDPSPLQHFWSLAVEEQYYLVWPLLLSLVAVAAVRSRRLSPTAAITGTVLLVVGTSFAYSVYLTTAEPAYAYFLTTTRAWELGVGGLVAVAAGALASRRWLQSGWVGGLGLLLMAGSALVYTEDTPFPGWTAAVPVAGAAMVIASGMTRSNRVETWLLDHSPVQGIGRLSYGWYLWHWPVLVIAEMYLQRSLRLPEALVLVAVALWLAMCSYIAVEVPIRSYPSLQASPARSLKFGAMLIASTLVVGLTATFVAPRLLGLGGRAAEITDSAQLSAAVIAGQGTAAIPANLTPDLTVAADDKPDLNAADGISCMVGLHTEDVSSDPGGSCVAGGTEDGATTVVLAGDSHAYHWIPALREIAIERNWRLVSMTKSGCPLYDVLMVNTQLKREYTECTAWREKVYERIEREHPAMVITSGAIFSPRDQDFSDRWVRGVGATVGRLNLMDVRPVVIEDVPYPRQDVPKCLAQNPTEVAVNCMLSVDEALSDQARRAGTAGAATAAGAVVISPQNWFCGPQSCPPVIGQFLVYSDNSHISATYSAALAPLLGQLLPAA